MKITDILDLKWNYQMTENLFALLFDSEKRNQIFDRYLDTQPDLSQDCFLEEFQSQFADRSNLKQDYTPSSICQLVAQVSGNAKSVLDVCSGTGALTIAKWSQCPDARFYCEEYSKEALAILLFNLSVRGINAEVRHCDVLSGENFGGYKLTRNGRYSDITQCELNWADLTVDCVISNPPYSLSWTPKADPRFDGYALAPKSKADFAFLLHGLHHLNDNGKACFILPHGVLFRGQAEETIRKALLDRHQISAVLGLPEKLFLATSIPTAVLVLQKARSSSDVFMLDGRDLFEQGKKQNTMTAEHIRQIVDAYNARETVPKLATLASLEMVQQNDYNLNLPRYVDTSDPPEIPDFLQEAKALLEISQALEQSQQQFLTMLNEVELSGTKKDIEEFEQAKKYLKQAFAPRQFKTAVIEKIQHLNPENYQMTIFNQLEMEELTGFIEQKEKQIEILKKFKQYFLSKMFI